MSGGEDGRCAACDSVELLPHLQVSKTGVEELVPTTNRFGTAPGDIVRCRRCGHRQVHPMPAVQATAQGYAEAESLDYVEEERGQRATARRWLAELETYAPRRGRLLDLGCWVGYLVSEAERRGWEATGVEPSDFASRFAREQLGLNVITADLFTSGLPSADFDLVTMNDVIEHLITPAAALDRVRSLLRPGGLLALQLPDAGSSVARVMGRRWWSVIPTHVQYFTRGSIGTLLERRGFEVLEISTAPKTFTLRYYIERLSGYSQPLARRLVGAADATGVGNRLWTPDFRDRMGVIARSRYDTP